MNLFTEFNFIYWIVLALLITLETLTVGVVLARREAARWTIGYATVFVAGLPLVLLGQWDAATFAALFVGVGIAGAVKVGLKQISDAHRARLYRHHGLAHPDIVRAYHSDRWPEKPED
jgi:hypothetical protein